jgi:DNA polymerase-3 subunit delta
MAEILHAIDYLVQPERYAPRSVVVVFGEDRFLKRTAIDELRRRVLAGADAEFSQTVFDGQSASLRDVIDELSTVALFGSGGRFVVVEQADEFVSAHRAELEDYVGRPRRGTLVLDVRGWPSNTRLYKAVAAVGLAMEANPPTPARLRKWLVRWARKRYEKGIDPDAIDLLLDLVGPDPGRLDQELAKLSAALGQQESINLTGVSDLVGGWRAKTIWEMLDSALAGEAPSALRQLDRLLASGENPIGLLAQIGSTLRRLATATRLIEQAESEHRRLTLRAALEEAGIRAFVLAKAEAQLRQLGRQRAGELYQWLIDADLALKGDSAAPPRLALEQLIVRMANPRQKTPGPAAAIARSR